MCIDDIACDKALFTLKFDTNTYFVFLTTIV